MLTRTTLEGPGGPSNWTRGYMENGRTEGVLVDEEVFLESVVAVLVDRCKYYRATFRGYRVTFLRYDKTRNFIIELGFILCGAWSKLVLRFGWFMLCCVW